MQFLLVLLCNKPRVGVGVPRPSVPNTCCFVHIPEEDPAGGAGSGSHSKLQWQKVLSSPNLWTDMTLVLH